ncbi:MAG: glycosyltransferase family 2 protein [Rikenellaceae bacterium]
MFTSNLSILLATYNSVKFLESQIESLLNQTYTGFTIYVHDDGSTDNTVEILRSYAASHSNIVLLEDATHARGAMRSFMWMLEHVEADYYMFCDHDDVWLPQKIELSLGKMREIETVNTPAMVFTNLKVVDGELNVIAESMWGYEKLRPAYLSQLKFAVTKNIFTGCTMLFNNSAKQVSLPLSPKALMHDSWVGLKVLANAGVVGYVETPQVLYRQHGNNVVGSVAIDNSFKYYLSKVTNFLSMLKKWRRIYEMSNCAIGKRTPFLQYYYWKFYYLIIR